MERRHVFDSTSELAAAVCGYIARDSAQAKARGQRYALALAGGATPRLLHVAMVSSQWVKTFCWDEMEFFFGDERMVPPDHRDSNYRMAYETLFSRAPIAPEHIHRIKGELTPAMDAAIDYEKQLNRVLTPLDDGVPQFDLVLLGLGSDGHIASLFPDTDILNERKRWVAATYVPKLEAWRVSLTLPVINRARKIFVLITGESKSDIVASVFNDASSADLPVKRLAPHGELHWFIDSKAARRIAATA